MTGVFPTGTSNSKKPRLYGDPLMRLRSILNNLRLTFKDVNKNSLEKRYIDIPGFGVRIVFSSNRANYDADYKMMYYNPVADENDILSFGNELMWHVLENGYMAYIREHPDGGNENIFRKFLISEGWGKRIIDKRIEAWEKIPHKEAHLEWLHDVVSEFSTPEIISRYPTFFDFVA